MSYKPKLSEKQYAKVLQQVPILCVDIVIVHEGKYLLVKRKFEPLRGLFWVPGGRVYRGETLERAAVRKALEETGLHIKIHSFEGFYDEVWKQNAQDVDYTHTVSAVFIASPMHRPVIVLDEQSSEYKWSLILPDLLTKKLYKVHV